jgi:hypothetical protein
MAHWRQATPRLARAIHGAGGELYVWTVDDAKRIRRFERDNSLLRYVGRLVAATATLSGWQTRIQRADGFGGFEIWCRWSSGMG